MDFSAFKPLPTGQSDFPGIREDGAVYVDKTRLIAELACRRGRFFLARPRRFGKSLLISTFKALFEGRAELFQGLEAEKLLPGIPRCPVLWIDFSRARDFETVGEFKEFLDLLLCERAAAAGFTYEAKGTPEASFGRLLSEIAASGTRIALLIDEYDSPLTSHLDSPELFNAVQRVLSRFYSTVKSLDGALQFLFITGITRFSHTSIFSAFNSLDDLTYRSRFSTLLGYTEEDLRAFFGEYLRNAAGILRMPENQLLDGLRRHYDGYCFDASLRARVYAPWSVLKFLGAPEAGFKNYWYQSAGRPSALLSVLRASPLLSPEAYSKEIAVFEDRLSSAQDYAHIDPLAIFLQAGCLTLKRRNPDGSFVLDCPNQEVNESIAWLFADELTNGNRARISGGLSAPAVLEKGGLGEAAQLILTRSAAAALRSGTKAAAARSCRS